jgi:hypothetical protein
MYWNTNMHDLMEMGSFIELDIRNTGEYFADEKDTARLNSARAGIYHSLQVMETETVYLPNYLCPSVKKFLLSKNIKVLNYLIDDHFKPSLKSIPKGTAIMLVNYFGIFSREFMKGLVEKNEKVILDNSQAFFAPPLEGFYNVYSPRKFFGVPDGCYVVGPHAEKYTETYEQDHSSDHAGFLFKRIEYGCSSIYSERMQNEERIDSSGVKRMSELSRALLKGIDYAGIRQKRIENFNFLHDHLKSLNLINPAVVLSETCAPMVYPFVYEKEDLLDVLKKAQIYTGRWWSDVLTHAGISPMETKLCSYMLPLPIDQRYGINELSMCVDIIRSHIST